LKEIVYFEDIKQGNKEAFDNLFLFYYQQLCRFAFAFTQDRNNSEEVVQRMFVRLWENRKKIIIPKSEKAYLCKSVYNEYLKYARSKKTRDLHYNNYLYFYESDEDAEHFEELKNYLNKAIEKLPNRCKEIFILNKIEGLTQKEIADVLGISVKTVENQIAIAVSKLREDLKPIMNLLPSFLILMKLLK
jgi:RNA polymerase sigma-70 factor (ECF subfamily)